MVNQHVAAPPAFGVAHEGERAAERSEKSRQQCVLRGAMLD